MKKYLVGVFFASLGVAVTVVSIILYIEIVKVSVKAPTYNREYELAMVREDLKTYGYLSTRFIDLCIKSLDSASRKYNIPVGLIHAQSRIESDYQPFLTHPTVSIDLYVRDGYYAKTYKLKRVTTSGKGMGGVIWECWSDSLKKHGIAEVENDLYMADVSIFATAMIDRLIINEEIRNAKKNNRPVQNLIGTVQKKYFGAYNAIYYSKMITATSDLWMKRMDRQLKDTGVVN